MKYLRWLIEELKFWLKAQKNARDYDRAADARKDSSYTLDD